MTLGKKKLLAAFLEKDNIKLLVYEVGLPGTTLKRVFAGQITFAQEILRDAFVADAGKFNSQLKVAFAQKPILREVTDVLLFLPADKTFTKTMDASDSLDGFIQSLPYFKEELIVTTKNLRSKIKDQNRVTYVAFEKKLVEDLQRPFLESGKTILAVSSTVNELATAWPAVGDYFLLIPLEKEIAFAVARDGALLEACEFKTDLFVSRFGEYVVNHNLKEMNQAYTLGVFPPELAEKIHHAAGLNLSSLAASDVYDLVVSSHFKLADGGIGALLGKIDLSGLADRLPGQRKMFLAGAAVVGFILVMAVGKNLDRLKFENKKAEVASPVAAPTPTVVAPEAKPADYKVRVLNGTTVAGEAGKLGDKLKALGFDVVETKNATSSGFVTTKLRVAGGVADKIVATIKSSLQETYETVFVEPFASDSAGVKIEIIIGKKK